MLGITSGSTFDSSTNRYMQYKGYTIEQIYQSADGRGNHDYFISSSDNPQGVVRMGTTLKKVKALIDDGKIYVFN